MQNSGLDWLQLQGILKHWCFISLLAKLRLVSAKNFFNHTFELVFHYPYLLLLSLSKTCCRVLENVGPCAALSPHAQTEMTFYLALHRQEELLLDLNRILK